MNGRLEYERVTPIEAHSLVKIVESRTLVHMLSNNSLCLRSMHKYMLLFLVLAVNSDWFQILCKYTLLLQPPVLALYYHDNYNTVGPVLIARI